MSQYLVEMSDGSKMELTANIIAECMYLKLDSEGHHHQIIHEIVYHKKNKSAIRKLDEFIRSRNGNRVPKITTHGWKLLVEWKYGSSDCIYLKDIKFSNPI